MTSKIDYKLSSVGAKKEDGDAAWLYMQIERNNRESDALRRARLDRTLLSAALLKARAEGTRLGMTPPSPNNYFNN
jgi:hypothetical protein